MLASVLELMQIIFYFGNMDVGQNFIVYVFDMTRL